MRFQQLGLAMMDKNISKSKHLWFKSIASHLNNKMDTIKWIKQVVKEHGKYQQEWYFGKFHNQIMWLYTIKSIVCIILNRKKSYSYQEYYDIITEMAHLYWRKTSDFNNGEGAAWTELSVAKSLKDWHIQIEDNSYP